MQHFAAKGSAFDMIIFVPNAGYYLSKLFVGIFGNSFEINFVKVRRASTVAKSNFAKEFVFRRKWLSDLMRHMEVLIRLVKFKLGIKQKMKAALEIGFNVAGKKILIIDDSVDTGTTLSMVKSALLKNGASFVATACISNHLLPDKVCVDYTVYTYALLRTINSRDYNAV
jgi:phosphoribosylpyrophosphate synthetase